MMEQYSRFLFSVWLEQLIFSITFQGELTDTLLHTNKDPHFKKKMASEPLLISSLELFQIWMLCVGLNLRPA